MVLKYVLYLLLSLPCLRLSGLSSQCDDLCAQLPARLLTGRQLPAYLSYLSVCVRGEGGGREGGEEDEEIAMYHLILV